ncbi:DNA-directed RNA polymerase subunit alpha [Candidatus Saccharibacteria bacterium]|nr:DNA-directed RNA polymerase subunit alpha [Candidatus Saccharibacteria bacterium]
MTTKNIHEAKLASVKELGKNSAEFVIKPLYPGYGNTLGNSLRRVLLSSVKGAAITAFSIEGTTHEYTAIPGIREDVVDIMLNLKNIRFKVHTDAPVELNLEMKGDKQSSEKDGDKRVVAGDIKLPAEVEIANPNQVICHIDDPKYTLKMHLVVESGRGYLTIERSSEERVHSDMIAIDAVFTPVLRVRYKVENTRVGQDTNLQQLTLTVDTDGTITPQEAFEEAAAILVNQYTALAGSTKVESTPAPGGQADDDDSGLMLPIEELDLSARTANALLNNDIKTIRDLVTLSEMDLKDLKGFGQKALDEVKEKLTELNI